MNAGAMGTWIPVKMTPSRSLCGTTPAEFGELLERLAPLVEVVRAERLARDDRVRAPGAGMKPKAFQFRLLVSLTHLRLGTSLRATALLDRIRSMSADSVSSSSPSRYAVRFARCSGDMRLKLSIADLWLG